VIVIIGALNSPIVVDGILSDEKIAELLGFQTEYPELDYKARIDLTTTEGKVELSKDVGAMQVRGGYIIAGADNQGALTGQLDDVDCRLFDEANLAPALLRWLPEPLELRTRVVQRDGRAVVVIYVGRHPSGCAFFRADGKYMKNDREVVVFRAGDVFWRNGTRSVRVTQQGLEEIIERRIADAKSGWLEEHQEIRRRERADLEAAYEGRQLTETPLGTVSSDLNSGALTLAALELLRRGDTIALRHLLNDAVGRARALIERGAIDAEVGDLLDKLTCLAATFLEYEQGEWFDRVIGTLTQIYSMPLGYGDAQRFGYSSRIDPRETAPRVWLLVIERVFALGALAVRAGNWKAVRSLTLQRPDRLSDYDANWLRHALTMASRAHHLYEQRDDGQTLELSLLSLARNDIARLDCLRPDGLVPNDDEVITSLAQFDVLSNIVAIDGAADTGQRVFYTNFARFQQGRIQPIVDRLLIDADMRQTLFTHGDDDLADALATIGQRAQQDGWRFDGFDTWDGTPVGRFISQHLPSEPA
jgi:hypothetical protein